MAGAGQLDRLRLCARKRRLDGTDAHYCHRAQLSLVLRTRTRPRVATGPAQANVSSAGEARHGGVEARLRGVRALERRIAADALSLLLKMFRTALLLPRPYSRSRACDREGTGGLKIA